MPQQEPGATGHYGAPPPAAGQWSGDDDWPQRGPAPWSPHPPPPPPGGRDGRSGSGIQPVTAAVIGVLVLVAAVAVALIVVAGHSSAPASSAAQGNAPAAGAPAQGGSGPVQGGGGGAGGNLFLGGTVTKISSTSITITAQQHVITAAITGSTQFTGSARNASGVKTGDSVMVTISGYGTSNPVCNSISDPAQAP